MSHGYPEREEALDISMFNSIYRVYIEGSVKLDDIGDDPSKDAERHEVVKPFYDFLMRLSNGQKFKLICTLFDRLFEVEQDAMFLRQDVTSLLNGGKINEDVTPGGEAGHGIQGNDEH